MPAEHASFALTMLVVGMGGTLVTLAMLALMMRGLTRAFPVRRAPGHAPAQPTLGHGTGAD